MKKMQKCDNCGIWSDTIKVFRVRLEEGQAEVKICLPCFHLLKAQSESFALPFSTFLRQQFRLNNR